MGILQRLFRSKDPLALAHRSAGDLDPAQFLTMLDKHIGDLNVPLSSPLSVKIGAFLIFGTEVARASAGYGPVDINTPFNECNGLVILIQQGIQALLVAARPDLDEKDEAFKTEFTDIFVFATTKVFNYDPNMPDDRARGVIRLGLKYKQTAQTENGALLQQMLSRWESLFKEISEQNVAALGQSYRDCVTWLNKRPMT